MIKKSCLIIFILLNLILVSSQAEPPNSWQLFNFRHSDAYAKSSKHAQNGNKLAVLDTTRLSFIKKDVLVRVRVPNSLDIENKYTNKTKKVLDIWNSPKAYLFQTFNASKFHKQHLHISAFVRGLKPNTEQLNELFDEKYTQVKKQEIIERWLGRAEKKPEYINQFTKYFNAQSFLDGIERDKKRFSEHIEDSINTAEYGMWVVLHLQPKYTNKTSKSLHHYRYIPTTANLIGPEEKWHRLNVEVSIPENCEAISIVFFADGLMKTEIDHVVIVPHGEQLEKNNGNLFSSFQEVFKDYATPTLNQWPDNANNLGFEY